MIEPVCCEKVVVENVDDDAAAMPEFRVQPLPALAGVGAVLGEAVDATVKVQPQSYFWGINRGNRAFDKVAHQAAELNLRLGSGKIEVYEVIQSLRILLCRIRISKAINALLESFWTSRTAAERSALGSSM